MDIWVTGGAWITAQGYGRMSEGKKVVLSEGPPVIPPAREVFTRPHQRYGRFDLFTRLGCAATALTLRDSGLEEGDRTAPIGMVVSTRFEVMETDMDYYRTTLEQEGILSSPNLFSYTLPVIVLGECSVLFNLTGPTFCVGENGGKGMAALQNAAGMISSGKAEKMLAGWIDSPPAGIVENNDDPAAGAIFATLDARPSGVLSSRKKLVYKNGGITLNDRVVSSMLDILSNGE